MRKRKLCLLTVVCALSGGIIHAEDKLILHPSDGTAGKEMELTSIKRLTFGATGVEVVPLDGLSSVTCSYLGLQKLTFDLTPTGVLDNVINRGRLVLQPNPAVDYVAIEGWNSSEKAEVTIFTKSGQLVERYKDWNGASIDVSSYPQDIYLLKINNQTFKFIKL